MIIRLVNIYRHMSCTNFIIIMFSSSQISSVCCSDPNRCHIDNEMPKDRPFTCDAAGEIM